MPRRLGSGVFWALAAVLTFLAYWIVLQLAGGSARSAALSALRNLLPVAILTAALQPVLGNHVVRWRPAPALAAHIGLAMIFALLWYWLLMVLIGLSAGDSPLRFNVRPFFPNPAVAWQLLQGVTLYALCAAIAYARAPSPLPRFLLADGAAEPDTGRDRPLSRYFIRQGDDIHPVEVAQIVSISGADDYAEVSTLSGTHLVRMTLADFEKVLDGGPFVRVHRSRIVNVDRIERAEPAGGGRMLLHMETGEMIQASRSGTRLLRERVI